MAQMYVWRSKTCENYGLGTVCVLADSIDEARDKAKASLVGWLRENRDWVFEPDWSDDLSERMITIERDISAAPTIVDSFVIAGSE